MAAGQYLNDSGMTRWTNPVLLPYLKGAYNQLELELVAIDAPAIDEETTTAIAIGINVNEAPAIADMLYPMKVWERQAAGNEGQWTELEEKRWAPDATVNSVLTMWEWREDKIKLLASSVAREIKVAYKRSLSSIVDINSDIPILLAKTYLAAKTAELATRYGGNNPTRADKLLEDEVKPQLNKFIGIIIRRQQFQGVQRQRFYRTQI